MKLLVQRLIAILLLVIPGIAAAYGFLLMKDAIYDYFVKIGDINVTSPDFAWGMFIGGAVLFLLGIGFIGGWIFFRDRKHNYLSSRFRPKTPRPPRPPKPPQSEDSSAKENHISDQS